MTSGPLQIGPGHAPRIVEAACRLGAERRAPRRDILRECCPEAEPIPFACYLDERNRRDSVEFTFSDFLARQPGPPSSRELGDLTYSEFLARLPRRAAASDLREPAEPVEGPRIEGRPREAALRGPRLGDVSPLPPEVQRRPRLDVIA